VESSEIDLSDFQEDLDSTNIPADTDPGQPGESGPVPTPVDAGGGFIISKIAFLMFFVLFQYNRIPYFKCQNSC
jgi:hypothetical protein